MPRSLPTQPKRLLKRRMKRRATRPPREPPGSRLPAPPPPRARCPAGGPAAIAAPPPPARASAQPPARHHSLGKPPQWHQPGPGPSPSRGHLDYPGRQHRKRSRPPAVGRLSRQAWKRRNSWSRTIHRGRVERLDGPLCFPSCLSRSQTPDLVGGRPPSSIRPCATRCWTPRQA